MTRRFITQVALFAALVFGLAGCATTNEDEPTSSGTSTVNDFDQGDVGRTDTSGTGTDAAALNLGTVYFDFDRYDIRSAHKSSLQSDASTLQQSGQRVVLEGNTDDRGSEEYNLALGDRRANAVKRYLTDLGVPSSQLRSVTYGESSPAQRGTGESIWQLNRRVNFRSSN